MSTRRTTTRRTKRGYRSSTENLTEESAMESENEISIPQLDNQLIQDTQRRSPEAREAAIAATDILLHVLNTPRNEGTAEDFAEQTGRTIRRHGSQAEPVTETTQLRQLNTHDTLIINRQNNQRFLDSLNGNHTAQAGSESTIQAQLPAHHSGQEDVEEREAMTPRVTRDEPSDNHQGNMTTAEVKTLARELVNALNNNLVSTGSITATTEGRHGTTLRAPPENPQNDANDMLIRSGAGQTVIMDPPRSSMTGPNLLRDIANNNVVFTESEEQAERATNQQGRNQVSLDHTTLGRTQTRRMVTRENPGEFLRSDEALQAQPIRDQQSVGLPRTADIPAPRSLIRRSNEQPRLEAPGRLPRHQRRRRHHGSCECENCEATASETDGYSTSQDEAEVAEERFQTRNDQNSWPGPKLRKTIKHGCYPGGAVRYSDPQPDTEIQREANDQLTRRLEQMEMKLQIQQAKLEQAEAIAKMARQQEESEKARNDTLTAILQSQASTSKISVSTANRVEEPMLTEDSDSEAEARSAPYSTERMTSHDRSRLTKKNRTNHNVVFSERVEHSGDHNQQLQESETQVKQWPIKPVLATTSNSGILQLPQGVNLEIPTFEGKNWPAFKNQFEMVAKAGQWNEEQKVLTLHNVIRGEARNVLNDPDSMHWSYSKLVENLEMRHGRTKSHGDVFIELMAMYRKPNQSLAGWNDEVVQVVNSGRLSKKEQERLKYMGFTYGLRFQTGLYNKVLSNTKSHEISEAFDRAYQYEAEHGSRTPNFVPPAKINMVGAAEAEEVRQDTERESAGEALRKFSKKQGFELEEKLTQVMSQQLQRLGDSLNQRLNQIDNRINRIERNNSATGFNFNNPPDKYRYEERRQMNQNFNNNRNTDFQQTEYRRTRGQNHYNRNRGDSDYNGNRHHSGQRDVNAQWTNGNGSPSNSNNGRTNHQEARPQPQRKTSAVGRGTSPKQE